MTATMAIRLLLGVLCLNELLRQHAQADQVLCKKFAQFAEGTVIAATSHNKRYCELTIGYFIVVSPNKLFHLECSKGHNLTQATAKITDLKDKHARNKFFDKKEMCEVKSSYIPTKNNMKVLAEKLAGVTVPYDRQSCNAEHYTEYLTKGAVQNYNIKKECPVFNKFNGQSSINVRVFQLAGKNGMVYEWPPENTKGPLVPSTMKKQSSGSNSKSRQPSSGFTGNGSTSISNTNLRGGYYGGRGGSYGGSGGGYGRSPVGTEPGVVPGTIPQSAGRVWGGNRHHDSSAASGRPPPFWGFKWMPKLGSKSFKNV